MQQVENLLILKKRAQSLIVDIDVLCKKLLSMHTRSFVYYAE